MNITRFEHSCMLVEEQGVRILTDLGSWTEGVPEFDALSALLITHEHHDHFDIEKLKTLSEMNPGIQVITHAAVGKILQEGGIAYTGIEPGETISVSGVSIRSYGTEHAIIYGAALSCRNTGFLVAEKLFIPGDALHDIPSVPVEILALPTGGPWMKVAEAIDYAKAMRPRLVFPIHDAMYTKPYRLTSVPRWMTTNLAPEGIEFVNMQPGDSKEF